MTIFLQILPYLMLAAIVLIVVIRHTERSLAQLAHASAAAHQRHMARALKRAWKAGNKKAAARAKARCYHYRVHACVYGNRQGVEL